MRLGRMQLDRAEVQFCFWNKDGTSLGSNGILPIHVGSENLRDGYRAVALLKVLHDRYQSPLGGHESAV
jgi:hypothetical protein